MEIQSTKDEIEIITIERINKNKKAVDRRQKTEDRRQKTEANKHTVQQLNEISGQWLTNIQSND